MLAALLFALVSLLAHVASAQCTECPCSEDSAAAPVNTAPRGMIITPASPPTITAGETVNFTGSATDDDLPAPPTITWDWQFPGGDPSSSTDQNPGDVTYASEVGSPRTATLTVSDGLLDDLSPPTVEVTIVAAESCGTWDDCDPFSADTIASGAWAPEGLGTWAITGGDLTNVYAVSDGLSRLRRTITPMDADNCQVIQVSSDDTVQSAPGLVMRSTSTNWASASWIEVIIVEDVPTIEVNLTTYTNGTSNGQESSFALGDTPPFWFGACIAGSGGSTEIDVFTWASEPSSDTSTWDAALVDTLTHDGTPVVDTNAANGFRNYRESPASGTLEIGYWEAINDVYTAPAEIPATFTVNVPSIEVGGSATDRTFSVTNIGDGSFDWTSTNLTIGDCNGGTAGGQDWVNVLLSPASGLAVTPAAPDVVTVQLTGKNSAECAIGGPYAATWTIPGTNEVPVNSPATLTVNLTVTAVGAGWPDADSTGMYEADRATLRGQCATLCSGGVGTLTSWSSTAPGDTLECLKSASNVGIDIQHDNVTVRCIEMAYGGTSGVHICGAGGDSTISGVVIEDMRIEYTDTADNEAIRVGQPWAGFACAAGTSVDDFTVSRIEIDSASDGVVFMEVTNSTVEDSWLHGFTNNGVEPTHPDAFETDGYGASNILITGNNVTALLPGAGGLTSLAMNDNNGGVGITGMVYDSNRFEVDELGSGGMVYCDDRFTGAAIEVTFSNNTMICTGTNYMFNQCTSPSTVTWTNNVREDTGAPIAIGDSCD